MDYKSLSPELVATLTEGLPVDSRVMMHYSHIGYTFNQLLMASIIDKLQVLIWQKTKDGHKGKNYPESLFEKFLEHEKDEDKKEELEIFDSPEAFEEWRRGKINV